MLGDLKGFQQHYSDNEERQRGEGRRWRQSAWSSVTSPFTRASSRDLAFKKKVFAPPENFPQAIADTEQRIYFIYADTLDSTTTAAMLLADLICQSDPQLKAQNETQSIVIYRHASSDKRLRLSEIITHEDLKNKTGGCVCIIPDAFGQGLQRSELSKELLEKYPIHLRDTQVNSYLIVTVDGKLPPSISDPIHATHNINLRRAFDNHVEHYFGADSAFADDPERDEKCALLDNVFTTHQETLTPAQIGALFEQINNEVMNRGVITLEEFARILVENVPIYVIDVGQRQRAWFSNLHTFNERLFGLVVALMQDLDIVLARSQYAVEELYFLLVERLSQNPGLVGEKLFIDPRLIGSEEMIRSLGISQTRLGGTTYLSFSSRMIREGIVEQADNYHYLLWVFGDVLLELMSGNARLPFEDAPEILANLLGRIGVRRQPRLWELISAITDVNPPAAAQDLALERQLGVALARLAALMLEPASRRPDSYDFLTQALQLWLPKKDKPEQGIVTSPQSYRASAHTVRLVYPILYETVYNAGVEDVEIKRRAEDVLKALTTHLTTLAENCGHFNPYLKQMRENQLSELPATIETFIEQQLMGDLPETMRQTVMQDNAQRLNSIRSELHKIGTQQIDEDLLVYSLRAIEACLHDLLDTLAQIAPYYPEPMVTLISGWIQRGLNTAREDYEEQVIEAAVADVIDDWERVGRNLLTERNTDIQQRRVNSDAIWYIGLAAANKLFWTIDFKPRKDDKDDKDGGEKKIVLKDKKDNNAATVADKKDTPTDEKASGKAIQMEIKTANDPQTGELPVSKPDTTPSTDQNAAGTDSNSGENPQTGAAPPNDKGGNTSSKIDDPPAKDAPVAEALQPQEALKTWLDIERALSPLLALLPLMLKSSVYEHNSAMYLKNLPKGDKIVRALTEGILGLDGRRQSLRFDPHLDMLLSTRPIEIALFRIRRWYEIVQSTRGNATAIRQWRELVYPHLLSLFNGASQDERHLLRETLFNQGWVNSEHAELRRIARSLLARSFVLDGIVMDLPLERYGVLVLDATRRPWGVGIAGQYYVRAFRLLQRLSMLTPMLVYYLGTDDKMLRVGSEREMSDSIVRLREDDLRPRRYRNRLLMPLFEEIRGDALFRPPIPDTAHFMLVLTPVSSAHATPEASASILDLLDVLECALPQSGGESSAPELWDPFADPMSQTGKTSANDSFVDWEWARKVFLISSNSADLHKQIRMALSGGVSAAKVDQLVTILDVNDRRFLYEDIYRLEFAVRRNIARYLYNRTGDQLRTDLEIYRVLPTFSPPDFAPLINQLRLWVYTLDDVAEAQHPRDITLTIMWSLLMLSRYDMRTAVSLIREWLTSPDKLPQQMGMALTRMLFNFLDAADPQKVTSDEIHHTLTLLDPLLALDPEYSEFAPVLLQTLENAHDPRWSEPLLREMATTADTTSNGGSASGLLDNLRGLSRRADARRILNDITFYENVWGLLSVYIQRQTDLDAFMTLLGEVYRWVQATSPARRAEEREQFCFSMDKQGVNLTPTQLSEMESVCASPVFEQFIGETLSWLVRFTQNIDQHNTPIYEAAAQRVSAMIDMMRLRVLSGGMGLLLSFERLSAGGRYGVILVDNAESPALRETALQFIHQFRREVPKQALGKLVIGVHILGRAETAFSGATGEPRPRDLLPRDDMTHPPLIGPILDRYPADQVGFVLLLTDREPLDWKDWTDDPTWAARFLLQTVRGTFRADVNRRQSRSNNKQSIFELTDEIMHILKEP